MKKFALSEKKDLSGHVFIKILKAPAKTGERSNAGFCVIIADICSSLHNPSAAPAKKYFLSKRDFVPSVTFFYSVMR